MTAAWRRASSIIGLRARKKKSWVMVTRKGLHGMRNIVWRPNARHAELVYLKLGAVGNEVITGSMDWRLSARNEPLKVTIHRAGGVAAAPSWRALYELLLIIEPRGGVAYRIMAAMQCRVARKGSKFLHRHGGEICNNARCLQRRGNESEAAEA